MPSDAIHSKGALRADALCAIEAHTGIALDGLDAILTSAKLDSIGNQVSVELELRIEVGDDALRKQAAALLRSLADRVERR